MSTPLSKFISPSREQLVHALYEAAELEHNLMCTYLYAAFSLKSGESEGLSPGEAAAVSRWRRTILDVAIDEMGHLVAVWNITAALGAAPRFGRTNFPLDPGYLPADVVVKLAPFNEHVLQHFIHLERPESAKEPDGEGFAPEFRFLRGVPDGRLTPMPIDYETVGAFYGELSAGLRDIFARLGEKVAFCGDPALQLSAAEIALRGAKPVVCLKTALGAFEAIVLEGEGAPEHAENSHFQRFASIRGELSALKTQNPAFDPAHPAATNPVLRRPPRPQGRVWLEHPAAIATVDLANSAYALMLRLIAYSYGVASPDPEKAFVVDLAIALMRSMTLLGERAARLPAGDSNPQCNAGVSFTALRDAAPLPLGAGSRRFFMERLAELARAAQALSASGDSRSVDCARQMQELAQRAERRFAQFDARATRGPMPRRTPADSAKTLAAAAPSASTVIDGVERAEGAALSLLFEGKRCIHARLCVTGAPAVFLANVQGQWLRPDAMDVEELVAIAHVCPSGAIRYRRKDGRPEEHAPPVNLIAVREAGPYAVRAELLIDGAPSGFRATLCRCGASKNKPFCDGAHHGANFAATGEPAAGGIDTLPVRDGPLAIDPQTDGPLRVRGNLEITSGTGRAVARVTSTFLCRCGASNNKPYCDGSHTRIGFRSAN